MTTTITPDEKFARIANEIRTNQRWRKMLASEDEVAALEEIAAHFGGQTLDTGANCTVALIPLGDHDCVGVTSEVVCHYHNSNATDIAEVFWENTNDASDGAVWLLDCSSL